MRNKNRSAFWWTLCVACLFLSFGIAGNFEDAPLAFLNVLQIAVVAGSGVVAGRVAHMIDEGEL